MGMALKGVDGWGSGRRRRSPLIRSSKASARWDREEETQRGHG